MNTKFAVIKTGGKQYLVQEGDIVTIEKLAGEEKEVEFKEVLLVDDGKTANIGMPLCAGVSVMAERIALGRGRKISVRKFKSKVRYRRNKGHRQPFTKVKIVAIG